MKRSLSAFLILCFVFLGPRIYSQTESAKKPVILPESVEELVDVVTKVTLDPRSDRSSQASMISSISLDPVARQRFVESVRATATPQQIRELEWQIDRISKAIRPSPASYGVAGSFRAIAWLLLGVNFHWFVQGYQNSFVHSPDAAAFWKAQAERGHWSFLAIAALAAFADTKVLKHELGPQRDWNRLRQATLRTLADLKKAIGDAKASAVPKESLSPHALDTIEQIPNRPLTNEEADTVSEKLVTAVVADEDEKPEVPPVENPIRESGLQRLLTALKSEENGLESIERWAQNDRAGFLDRAADFFRTIARHHRSAQVSQSLVLDYLRSASTPEAKELWESLEGFRVASTLTRKKDDPDRVIEHGKILQKKFSTWLAGNPHLTRIDLLKQSYVFQREFEENDFALHKMNKWGQRAMAAFGITIALAGAYTNTTDVPNATDLVIPGTQINLTDQFRRFMTSDLFRNSVKAAIVGLVTMQGISTLRHYPKFKTSLRDNPSVREAEWRFLRNVILASSAENAESDPSTSNKSLLELFREVGKEVPAVSEEPHVRAHSALGWTCRVAIRKLTHRTESGDH